MCEPIKSLEKKEKTLARFFSVPNIFYGSDHIRLTKEEAEAVIRWHKEQIRELKGAEK